MEVPRHYGVVLGGGLCYSRLLLITEQMYYNLLSSLSKHDKRPIIWNVTDETFSHGESFGPCQLLKRWGEHRLFLNWAVRNSPSLLLSSSFSSFLCLSAAPRLYQTSFLLLVFPSVLSPPRCSGSTLFLCRFDAPDNRWHGGVCHHAASAAAAITHFSVTVVTVTVFVQRLEPVAKGFQHCRVLYRAL